MLRTEYNHTEVKQNFERVLIEDAGTLANKRHVVYGIIQADVTNAKRKIHDWNCKVTSRNEKLSFTAYIASCIGKVVAKDPHVQGYKVGGCLKQNKVVIFQDVDLVVMIEPKENETAFPHIIRNVNKKTVEEISKEITEAKSKPSSSEQQYDSKKTTKIFTLLPKFLRMTMYRLVRRNPSTLKDMQGTVMLTSIGMFGRKGQGGIGITFLPMHTLGITLGGISRKPWVIRTTNENNDGKEEILPRDILDITVSFDHDVVDGARGARFASVLIETIEAAIIEKESNNPNQQAIAEKKI